MQLLVYQNSTKSGPFVSDIYSTLLKDRIIFLTGDIGKKTAAEVVAALLYLDSVSKTKEITIYINSHGGHLEGLFSIYDCMQHIKAPIKTICCGVAYSSAAVLLAAGTKGKRFALPNSHIMIHSVQVYEVSGSCAEVEIESNIIKQQNSILMNLISAHTGQSLSKVIRDCDSDMYFTPEEALAYGLIDKVVVPAKKLPKRKK